MTRALPFTQAGIVRAIAAARRAGLRVVGIRAADGIVLVQDGDVPIANILGTPIGSHDDEYSIWNDVEA